MKVPIAIAAIIFASVATPAQAGKVERLAACMWERIPQSAEDFIAASEQSVKMQGLFAGLAVCGDGDLRVNTKRLEDVLRETRPQTIGKNKDKPEVFTCMVEDGECKPVENN